MKEILTGRSSSMLQLNMTTLTSASGVSGIRNTIKPRGMSLWIEIFNFGKSVTTMDSE